MAQDRIYKSTKKMKKTSHTTYRFRQRRAEAQQRTMVHLKKRSFADALRKNKTTTDQNEQIITEKIREATNKDNSKGGQRSNEGTQSNSQERSTKEHDKQGEKKALVDPRESPQDKGQRQGKESKNMEKEGSANGEKKAQAGKMKDSEKNHARRDGQNEKR
ncbi:hypothetical protein RRG08_054291 [Elysia crispata]|uniref:Uncharacterized protein n=1 Tax=Elysia crispata TaxID=231223 RepID=A0AAE1D0P9_9GAST|nr:hypothetical protein RRG08_054291 [Elysia crispata]